MKPRNQFQKKILALTSSLKPLTRGQRLYGQQHCNPFYFCRSRNRLFCLECGFKWKGVSPLAQSLLGVTCPHCQRKLQKLEHYRAKVRVMEYYGLLDRAEDMQVVRIFAVYKYMTKLKEPTYDFLEVIQHWISPDGRMESMMRTVQPFTNYLDAWCRESSIDFRIDTYNHQQRCKIDPSAVYYKHNLTPVVERNGFTGKFHGIAPQFLLSMILRDHRCELLLKAGMYNVLSYVVGHLDKLDNLWVSLRICMRHRYVIEDVTLWADMIRNLRLIGLDLHSPHYVCPADLLKAHDRWMRYVQANEWKLLKGEREQEEIRLRKKFDALQGEYDMHIERFRGLEFSDGELVIRPMDKIEQFYHIGKWMHHCIYTNAYYAEKQSLMLLASVGDTPMEAMQVDIGSLKVTQSRGRFNQPTSYHDRIVELARKNMNMISKRLKPPKENENRQNKPGLLAVEIPA